MSLTRLLQLERLVWELSVWKETKQCQVHIPAESHNPLAVGCDIWGIFCKIKKNCKLKYPLTFYHLSVTFILETVWQCRWSSGAKSSTTESLVRHCVVSLGVVSSGFQGMRLAADKQDFKLNAMNCHIWPKIHSFDNYCFGKYFCEIADNVLLNSQEK